MESGKSGRECSFDEKERRSGALMDTSVRSICSCLRGGTLPWMITVKQHVDEVLEALQGARRSSLLPVPICHNTKFQPPLLVSFNPANRLCS